MTEIRFYHLEKQGIDEVLPAILSKALEQGRRVVVKTADENEAERLNDRLWIFSPESFLPHGTKKDGCAADQPVWLTAADENPNGADVLILTQGARSDNYKDFALCCEMLDGRDETAVSAARERWKLYKDAGLSVTYWQQGAQGWEKKNAG